MTLWLLQGVLEVTPTSQRLSDRLLPIFKHYNVRKPDGSLTQIKCKNITQMFILNEGDGHKVQVMYSKQGERNTLEKIAFIR